MAKSFVEKIGKKKEKEEEPKPIFFDLSKSGAEDRLNELIGSNPQIKVIDTYETQLKELFVLDNPPLHMNPPVRDKEFEKHKEKHYGKGEGYMAGKWVYLSWRNVLLHILDDDGYQQVRTGRNRNLITKEEQTKFYNSTIGIAGLSVGNSCALSIVLTGGGKRIKLADPDTLELTNLNRIRGSIAELTEPKVFMTARQIYELDPYADLTLYTDGLTEGNIEEFMDGLDVVVEEMDDMGMKVRLRQEAQKRGIPVTMATDNGDGGLLDIERYDQTKDIVTFHGRAGDDIAERTVGKKLPLPMLAKIITEELVGADIVTSRMKKSLLAIGSELPTWPQLGGAALLNGVVTAVAIRKILIGEPLVEERVHLSVESWLTPEYHSKKQVEERKKETEQFTKDFHEKLSKAPK